MVGGTPAEADARRYPCRDRPATHTLSPRNGTALPRSTRRAQVPPASSALPTGVRAPRAGRAGAAYRRAQLHSRGKVIRVTWSRKNLEGVETIAPTTSVYLTPERQEIQRTAR